MKKHMNKIAESNLSWLSSNHIRSKTLLMFLLSCAFLLPSGCLMTKSEGNDLSIRLSKIEGELAKLERVRHDLEILLSGKVGDLYERIARMESTLDSLQESTFTSSLEKDKLTLEIQDIKNQLELAKEHIPAPNIPKNKEDHFAKAKKLYLSGDLNEAILLFDELIKKHPADKILTGQAYYLLGEIYHKQSQSALKDEDKLLFNKKAIVHWQKVIELGSPQNAKEESLYKMGLLLKSMGNKEAAKAAFTTLLETNRQSVRAGDARKSLAELDNDK